MSENIGNVVAKKRGRKSKKDMEEAQKKITDETIINIAENIVVKMEETEPSNQTNNSSCIDEILISDSEIDNINTSSIDNKPVAKKRGRKPKGGKIIQQVICLNNVKEPKPNVILHLKCSLKDLSSSSNLFSPNQEDYNSNFCYDVSNVKGYSFSNSNFCYDIVNNEKNLNDSSVKLNEYDAENDNTEFDTEVFKNKENDIREIWKKLKVLEHNLHVNNIGNKKSACFWDTCEFDNPPVYIPKYFMNDTYHVYGCFCSPECAVAHLMEENIDSSIKFERYQLMNHIYSKIYDYSKNIKPAPNPYYMLEKYYGNLSTQEYRSLLRNERLFLVVDKPLTRIMPELHEDNDDFIINNKIIPTNNIKLRKIQRKQTKTNILSERFGLNQ
jgi:hypothetical protein